MNSFKTVRFEKEPGKIPMLKSVLSKKAIQTFSMEVYMYDDFGNKGSA